MKQASKRVLLTCYNKKLDQLFYCDFKTAKTGKFSRFPTLFVLKIGLWHLNRQVIHAHAYHLKKIISHLSLLNLPWFIFENVHVFGFIQIITQNQFYFLLYTLFFSVGYDLYIPRLLTHRASLLKKDYQCRPPNNLLVNIFAKVIFDFSGRKSFTAMAILIAHWLCATSFQLMHQMATCQNTMQNHTYCLRSWDGQHFLFNRRDCYKCLTLILLA